MDEARSEMIGGRGRRLRRQAAGALLGAATVLLVAANLWVTLARSWIPWAIDDRVSAVVVAREKHPGVDDVYFVHFLDASPRQADPEVAAALRAGDRIRKDAWSPSLEVGGRTVALTTSRDFDGMVLVAGVVLLVAGGLLRPRGRPGGD